MPVRIVHCSDLHLDKSFNFLSLQNSARRKQDIRDNFAKIVDFALKERADLFLITGDVFDKVHPSNQERLFLTREVRRLKEAGVRVFAIGGNHDVPRTPGASTMAIEVLSGAGLASVFPSSEAQSETFEVDGQTIQVAGRSYLAQFEQQNPLKGLSLNESADRTIFMVHGSLLGVNAGPGVAEMAVHNPFSVGDIPPEIDYLALGHLHHFFERKHGGCRIVNPGSIERLDWNEQGDKKGFAWVEMSDSETRIEFVPLETREMESRSLSLTGAEDELTKIVLEYMERCRDPEKIFRLGLCGTLSLAGYSKVDLDKIYQLGREAFFDFDLDKRDLVIEGEKIFFGRVDNPVEAYQKRVDALILQAESDDERQLLVEAKELGMKLLEEAGT